MKTLICLLGSVVAISAWGENLSPQDIRERLELRAEIYTTDADGAKILSGPERTAYWRMNPDTGELKGNWSSNFAEGEGSIGIFYDINVTDAGAIVGKVSEYKPMSDGKHHGDPKPDEMLQTKEFANGGLEPVLLKIQNISQKHYIVRLIPSLKEISKPISVNNLPVAGTGISVFDSDGYIWAENLEFNGKYSGLTAHRGTLALSYLPFPGGRDMGMAEGNMIVLRPEKKLKITLKSGSAFLPAGVTARVYAAYLPKKKTQGFNSIHSFDTSKVERLEEALK